MSSYITIVSYDDNDKDIPCAVCLRQRRDGKKSMCVGYTNDNARELNRIVTEQGYLEEHDAKVRADIVSELKDRLIKADGLGRKGLESVLTILEQMKEQS